jgi:hypothetical protein
MTTDKEYVREYVTDVIEKSEPQDPHQVDGIVCSHDCCLVQLLDACNLKRYLGLDECDVNDTVLRVGIVRVTGCNVTRCKRSQLVLYKATTGRPQIKSRETGRDTWTSIRENDIRWIIDVTPAITQHSIDEGEI